MKLRLPMHGRTHHPLRGSDPIPGIGQGIQFDVDNQGGWLEITARGEVPGGDNAIEITTLAEDGGAGDFDITTAGHFLVDCSDLILLENSGGPQVQIGSAGIVALLLTAGSTYIIKDHLGSALVTYTG